MIGNNLCELLRRYAVPRNVVEIELVVLIKHVYILQFQIIIISKQKRNLSGARTTPTFTQSTRNISALQWSIVTNRKTRNYSRNGQEFRLFDIGLDFQTIATSFHIMVWRYNDYIYEVSNQSV